MRTEGLVIIVTYYVYLTIFFFSACSCSTWFTSRHVFFRLSFLVISDCIFFNVFLAVVVDCIYLAFMLCTSKDFVGWILRRMFSPRYNKRVYMELFGKSVLNTIIDF